ncbi:hypothetical protein INH39_24485 [Massilia violaceinigra]|uniref:Uncharacterized protein n=1 Tax=Massilia violaceinigra TaxID=2045208 RepID=A0ABY4A1E1_9BURK|nr:hypothetical protein [Massilia violaceinigra]UOD28580.1 hypothetical protein INH39_24485 [Massilia violaceinigra]
MKTFKVLLVMSTLVIAPLAFAIVEDDPLAHWGQASPEERVAVIESIAKSINKDGNIAPRRSDLRFLINCVNDYANNISKDETIRQAVKGCWNTGNFDTRLTIEAIQKERDDIDAVRKTFRGMKRPSPDSQ